MPEAWIAQNCRGGRRHLHAEEDCTLLQQAKRYRPVEAANFPNNPRCSYCYGDGPERPNSHEMGPYQSLQAAAGGGD